MLVFADNDTFNQPRSPLCINWTRTWAVKAQGRGRVTSIRVYHNTSLISPSGRKTCIHNHEKQIDSSNKLKSLMGLVNGFAQTTFITENSVGFDLEKWNLFHIKTSTRRVKLKIQKSKLISTRTFILLIPLLAAPHQPTHNRIFQWRMGWSTKKGWNIGF